MKTIEERAEEYVNTYYHDNFYPLSLSEVEADAKSAFIAGANAKHKELTRWHDPKEELPEYYKAVEVKYKLSGLIRISTAWLSAGDAGGLWTIDGTNRIIKNIIGWREIRE